jgi:glucan phosphorylase
MVLGHDPQRVMQGAMTLSDEIDIAYFSMEIAVNPAWPTYSGGLGTR